MPDATDPDAMLMLRVKRGDRAAFEELVARYQQPVLNFIFRTLPDATEAEDLAQGVFVQVWKSAARYEPSAKFSTWLFTIARNLCLNEFRRRSRHPADSLDAPAHAGTDEPRGHSVEEKRVASASDAMLCGELEEKVAEALAALPENQRTALLLWQRDELAYDDIAEVLGCSLSAVKSLIHRARETLKARLKPYLRTGEWKDE
ncbi:MAG: sigma-70 family RNA polymerase sigma factor [Verrucomicrobia bacterium]|nr:sigma-70 family RNA polymerase sigma factor [Verrucomicrobiota bacterium]